MGIIRTVPAMIIAALLSCGCGVVSPVDSRTVVVKSIPNTTYCLVLAADTPGGVVCLPEYHYKTPGPWGARPHNGKEMRIRFEREEYLTKWVQADRYAVVIRDRGRHWYAYWFTADELRECADGTSSDRVVDLAESPSPERVGDPLLKRLGIRFGLRRPTCVRLAQGEDRSGSDSFLGGLCRHFHASLAQMSDSLERGDYDKSKSAGFDVLEVADDFVAIHKWTDSESRDLEDLYVAFDEFREALESSDRTAALRGIERMKTDVEHLCAGH